MKRLKSSDDLNSYGGEKGVFKDWGRKDDDLSLHQSSSLHRSFHYKSESGKKGLYSSSSRNEQRGVEDDHKNTRLIRKRPDYDVDSNERRKSYDRYKESSEKEILSSSPRGGYGYSSERIHRSESFSGPRRDFPKGFRSERDRSRRERSVSSWRRFGKDVEEGTKSGGDSGRGSKTVSEEVGNVRSPQGGRNAKSPDWSKDSESEQSRSFEVKKSECFPAESGNNSEREEGELEPEPEPEPEPDPEPESEPASVVTNLADDPPSRSLSTRHEVEHENSVDDKCLVDKEKLIQKEEIKPDQTCIPAEEADVEEPETLQNKSSISEDSSTQRKGENEVAVPLPYDNKKKNIERIQEFNAHKEEAMDVSGNSKPVEIKPRQDNIANHEVKEENQSTSMHVQVTGNAERHDASVAINHSLVTKELTCSFKDKGKSVIVSASSGNDESSGFLTSKEIVMEGPSARGFDLFFMDSVKKPVNVDQKGQSKPKDENLSMEPLELSLRLPSVLLPIGCQNPVQGSDSPSQEMSIQSQASSFQTSSDGFTRSFSGSQHYTHNPSCSLTETSFDFEKSVGSRPLFQDVVWQVQPSDDPKNTEPPVHQTSIPNGNGMFHHSQTSQASQGVSNVQSLQLHNARGAEGSYKTPLGLERRLSSNNNNKQPSGSHSNHRNEIRSPTQSVGSHDTGSDYHKDRKRVMSEVIGTLSKSSSPADMVESLLAMIVSDSLNIVTRILSETSPLSLASLKESARDIILNPSKQRQFSGFRKALEKRSDITLETLSKAHKVQIEILIALKTGIQDFLQTNSDISSSDLAEIFLNVRCRNLTCRSYLPVDECDCKICVQKKGFCSACMCLVCSKFDMASNTCSWVGCDVCLHFCHTECGLRESYIRNSRSVTGALDQTEMQFFCVACDHPSEMFGFVREVFQNFAKGWTAEALAKELEYVRRIFSASNDIRGKRLHEICYQMLTRLSNKSDLQQVRSYIMGFLIDDDAFKSDNIQISQGKELSKQNWAEQSSDIPKTSQEAAMWMKSVYAERPVQVKTSTSDIQRAPPPILREFVFDELDGIVRIKLAEAQMFQMRADDARRESEGLNRIAQAKSKKIDEEYASRVTKLHLSEAEEIRRQKFEEFQALENAHQEYFNMKVRMEREIKDLLLKMEATKCNLGW